MDENRIAIVGLACRFPGAKDASHFWELLQNGQEGVRALSHDEAIRNGADPSLVESSDYVLMSSDLESADCFDAEFFGVTPGEAAAMDPQHRVFLECAWHALEEAGHPPDRFRGQIGCFAGSALSTYLHRHVLDPAAAPRLSEQLPAVLGNDKDYLAARVAHLLGLRGPTVACQSACSTGLLSVHLACQSLLLGECDLALAGAVSIRPPFGVGYLYERGMVLSPDGHTRSFDVSASGTLFGSGAGVVVLRRLEDALSDGDAIRAVILGSAVNNDGSERAAFHAPSVRGQERVIAEALGAAGVSAGSVGMLEAHGTATVLGDATEVAALRRVFENQGAHEAGCALGSVKSNLGHLEVAAGIAGLIKAVLAMEHREIPPSLHYEAPNPELELEGSPFYLADRLRPWPSERSRRAGVSSFGMGGTNVHVVLEEAPSPTESDDIASDEPLLLTLAAHGPSALERRIEGVRAAVDCAEKRGRLRDLCVASVRAPRRLRVRTSAVGTNGSEIVRLLAGRSRAPRGASDSISVAMIFSGQGSQYAGMGRDLYRRFSAFREAFDACAEVAGDQLGEPLTDLAFARGPRAEERLRETRFAQPVLFSLEWALAELWAHVGVVPAVLGGHSLGELVAACRAGVVPLEDGLRLAIERGDRMQRTVPGRMVVVSTSVDRARDAVADLSEVDVAADNAADQVVLSGAEPAVEEALRRLRPDATTFDLPVRQAFHSPLMEAAVPDFGRVADRLLFSQPQIPLLSNVSGGAFQEGERLDAEYWCRQLRGCVRFRENLEWLRRNDVDVVLEVGPGSGLAALAARHDGGSWICLSSMDAMCERTRFLRSVGALFEAGLDLEERAIHGERERGDPRLLPPYPFEVRRHWIDAAKRTASESQPKTQTHPLSGTPLPGPRSGREAVTGEIAPRCSVWRALEGMLADVAACETIGIEVEGLELFTGESVDTARYHYAWGSANATGSDFAIHGQSEAADDPNDGWVCLARGTLRHAKSQKDCDKPWQRPSTEASPFDGGWSTTGFDLRPPFGRIRCIWKRSLHDIAFQIVPDSEAGAITEGWLELAVRCTLEAVARFDRTRGLFRVARIAEMYFTGADRPIEWCEVRCRGDEIDLDLREGEGALVLAIKGLELRRASIEEWLAREGVSPEGCSYAIEWRPSDCAPPRPTSPGRWYVVGDDSALRRAVERGVEAAGGRVVVDPDASALPLVEGVAVAFDGARLEGESVEPVLRSAIELLLETNRSIAEASCRPTLRIVTSGALAGDGRVPDPVQAAVLAMGRVLEVEHPELRVRRIDVCLEALQANPEGLGREILVDDVEREVRIEANARLVPRIVRSRADELGRTPTIKIGSAYVVTGGTGGLGAGLVDWLLCRGAGRVHVISRSGQPDGTAWRSDPRVRFWTFDLDRPEGIQEILEEAEDPKAPIRGVFHAAGLLEDALLATASWNSCRSVLAPKALAVWWLDQASTRLDLDFFVVLSSMASLLGEAGQGAYAAANAFAEAIVQTRLARGEAGLALALGPIARVGMAARRSALQHGAGSRALVPLEPDLSIALLPWWSRLGAVPLIVRADWNAVVRDRFLDRVPPLLRDLVSERCPEDQTRRSEPRSLRDVVREVLQLDHIQPEDSFASLGGDSLTAVRVAALAQDAGIHVTVQELLSADRIGDLGSDLTKVPAGPTEMDESPLLSPAQQGISAHAFAAPDDPGYVQQMVLRAGKRFEPERFRKALQEVVRRHPALRMRCRRGPEGPEALIVADFSEWPWSEIDLRTDPDAEGTLASLIVRDREIAFDLERGPTFRVTSVQLPGGRHALIWAHHHVVMDAWSIGIVVRDLVRLYNNEPLPEARRFARGSYNRWLRRRDLRVEADFWASYFDGFPGSSRISDLAPRPRDESVTTFVEREVQLPEGLMARLEEVSRRLAVTLGATVVAAWSMVLRKIGGGDDVAFAITTPGRPSEVGGIDQAVGMFTATLPLRIRVDPGEERADLCRRVHRELARLRPFENISLADIWRLADIGTAPVDHVVLFDDFPMETLLGEAAGMDLESSESWAPSHFPLTLLFSKGDRSRVRCLFDSRRIDRRFADSVLEAWVQALTSVAADPEGHVARVRLVAEADSQPFDPTVSDVADVSWLFNEAAARHPSAIALLWRDEATTYGELETAVCRLSERLLKSGVVPGSRVGLACARGPDLITSVLAIAACGAAVVPLDPALPRARIAAILEDATPTVTLAQGADVPAAGPGGVRIRIEGESVSDAASGMPGIVPDPEAALYVLYTSGTTGRPKGVVFPRRALSNLVAWHLDELGAGMRMIQYASIGFDASFHEILATLCGGGTLILLDEEARLHPRSLATIFRTRDVEKAILPVTMLNFLCEEVVKSGQELPALRHLMATGERLVMTEAIREFHRRHPCCRLHNHYGPTETHVITAHTLTTNPDEWPDRPPIGRPIPRSRVEVRDPDGELLPPAIVGELLLGGTCVASGYLGRSELTEARFVGDGCSRWYRSGDFGWADGTGSFHFEGRRDDQVKIRGQRVELAEVVAALKKHPELVDAVVVPVGEPPSGLAAYVVTRHTAPSDRQLRAFLGAVLPSFMIPAQFVEVGDLPTTRNGKVDVRRLRERVPLAAPHRTCREPRDAREAAIARLFAEILGVEQVGCDEEFVADLGGHSIQAIALQSRLEQELGIHATVPELLTRGTVSSLASERDDRSDSGVVVLRTGTGAPFVLIHPVGGSVFPYVPLVRHLGGRSPVWGIASEAGVRSLAAMAEGYRRQLGAQVPTGPLFLGGWSMGAVLAIEVARLLRAAGRDVATVVAIDPHLPETVARTRHGISSALAFLIDVFLMRGAPLSRDLRDDLRASDDGDLSTLRELLEARTGISLEVQPEVLQPLFERYCANFESLVTHRMNVYDGRVLRIRAGSEWDAPRWRGLCPAMRTVTMPGDHYSVMRGDGVGRVAQTIRRELLEHNWDRD